jgi:hypothetical protein
MKKAIILSVLPVLAVCILGVYLNCGPKGGGNPVGPGNQTPTFTMTGTFRATADTIYLSMNTWLDTNKWCNVDSMIVRIDTISNPGEISFPYSISGNTMTYSSRTSKFMYDSGSWVIELNAVYNHLGTGAGLQGTWIASSEKYTLISGILPDSTRRRLDSTMAAANQSLSSGEYAFQLTFSGNQITESITYKNETTQAQADDFVSSWDSCTVNGRDTCQYAISVTKLNNNSAQLHGTKSNETVTIVWNTDGDMSFTSSDTTHHAYIYYAKPTSCPNFYEPPWYYQFISANVKTDITLAKRNSQPVPAHNRALRAMLKRFLLR